MITFNIEKCSGCSRCEVHCAFFHSGRAGRSPASIKVARLEEIGIDFAVVCQQCVERYCLQCPEKALSIGPLGEIQVAPRLCTGCGECVALCPIGAIELYERLPMVCDLCGGSPRCVEVCTLGAVQYEPQERETVSLEDFQVENDSRQAEEKRVHYALSCSRELRQRWETQRRS